MTTIAQERAALTAVGMRHRRREQWGAVHNYTTARAVDEPANRVFVHITVTNPGNYNSFDAHARAIEAIGRARFGTSSSNTGISYNRLFMAGTRAIYEAQPIGRRGAHTVNDFRRTTCTLSGCPGRGSALTSPASRNWNLNYNARSYAYASNVGFTVPDHVVDDMARAIAADKLAGFVTRSAPIHGHRCVSAKSCPGDRLFGRLGEIQAKVNHYLRVGLGGGTTPPASGGSWMSDLNEPIPYYFDGRNDDGTWPTEPLRTSLGRTRSRAQTAHENARLAASRTAAIIANQEGMKAAITDLAKALASQQGLDQDEFARLVQEHADAGAEAALRRMISDARVELTVDDDED